MAANAAVIAGPALGAGEQMLASGHAVHKKTPGTAWFTSRRALWRAADGKAPVQRVEVAWGAIKSFQVLEQISTIVVYTSQTLGAFVSTY